MRGTTLGVAGRKDERPFVSTAFGETANKNTFFTEKPNVTGLGYAFLFRNYRANLGKWQTAVKIASFPATSGADVVAFLIGEAGTALTGR